MGKDKSFASKMSRATAGARTHCPECGEVYTTLKVVKMVKNEEKGSHKFNENNVAVCKCNQQEVMS